MALIQNCKKHIPWVAAALGAVLALSKDCTLNAYASSKSVEKLEGRVNTIETRLVEADRGLADKLDAIYLLLARHHEDSANQEYCR